MKLSLYNTLTRKTEVFKPIDDKAVKMYVCGPTVYDNPHIGNARSVVIYDLLYRLLIKQYGKNHVLYVRNITDVDDKIINKSKTSGESLSQITAKTIQGFHEDMNYLGCLPPNLEPKATEHITEMLDMIQLLIGNNCAYQIDGHVFFRVSKAKEYTKLSGRHLDELLQGVRVDVHDAKEHPADFVLWKPANENDPPSANFISPFGLGRPGWHIECSAMSYKYLGANFDIHGGGVDLIFPHHTNEIAQSCCAYANAQFAKFWVHNGFLTVDRKKMSKSLGNFITVNDIINKGVDGNVARLLLLSTNYRKPLDYNQKALQDAHKMISYWYQAIDAANITDVKNFDVNDNDIPQEFMDALCDDMNIAIAIRVINDLAKLCHVGDSKQYVPKLLSCAKFLGLMTKSPEEWLSSQQGSDQQSKKQQASDIDRINALIDQRNALKAAKKWQEADAIRDALSAENILIEDAPGGKTIWRKNNKEVINKEIHK